MNPLESILDDIITGAPRVIAQMLIIAAVFFACGSALQAIINLILP